MLRFGLALVVIRVSGRVSVSVRVTFRVRVRVSVTGMVS